MKRQHFKHRKALTLAEYMDRPKSFFKVMSGVGVKYDRKTNSYSFDTETMFGFLFGNK